MVSARQAGLAALTGLLPVGVYTLWSAEMSPYLAVVNVLLISVALYLMLSPTEGAQAHS